MASRKLKPCPFCGGTASLIHGGSNFYLMAETWSAQCDYGHAASPDLGSKEDAIAWWNTRPKTQKRKDLSHV